MASPKQHAGVPRLALPCEVLVHNEDLAGKAGLVQLVLELKSFTVNS